MAKHCQALLTANGNFLTNEYLNDYLVENPKYKSLTFDYSGQSKLFKRFDRKDGEQRKIAQQFVQCGDWNVAR